MYNTKEKKRAYARAYYLAHREEIKQRSTQSYRKSPEINARACHKWRHPGDTLDDKRRRLESQGFRCANPGCRTDDPGNPVRGEKSWRTWHTDHDHVTGKIRGELCGSCNLAIGMLEDNKAKILGLVRYLELY